MSKTRSCLKALAAIAVAGAVFVEAAEAEADPQTHDGFYLQLDAGLGYLSTTAEAGGMEVSYSGLSLPTSLLIGGTVGPVAIGGGFINDYTPSPSVSVNGTDVGEATDVSLYLIGIGVFGDIYPDPNDGFHIQPFIGWGGLEASYQGDVSGSDPTGLVIAIGAGYDFWVADEWSIGVMGRFTYGALSLNDVSYSTIAPALLATFTYH